MRIEQGTGADGGRLVALFDDAVAWLVARGQTGQWGSEPFSASAKRVGACAEWAAGGGLWFARAPDGRDAGALVLGEAPDYVPAAAVSERYVVVLLVHSAFRGYGVGAALIEHAREQARGVEQLRVDCWAGVPALPAHYERLGFTRVGSFDVDGWPGAVLSQPIGGSEAPPTH